MLSSSSCLPAIRFNHALSSSSLRRRPTRFAASVWVVADPKVQTGGDSNAKKAFCFYLQRSCQVYGSILVSSVCPSVRCV